MLVQRIIVRLFVTLSVASVLVATLARSTAKAELPSGWEEPAATYQKELQSDRSEVRSKAAMRLMHEGIPQLMNAKAYDLAASLALEATLAVPGAVDQLEFFQSKRVESLVAAGRYEEAVSAAKSLYNVSGMGFTRDMLSLVARTLSAAYPREQRVSQRFLAEQVEGARSTTQPYRPEAPATETPFMLSGVKVDPAPYTRVLQRESREDFDALMATGNLLLLSDKPQEAMEAFEKAYAIAPDYKLAYATESVARAIKAIDGTIGRANAFVLSVRPKDRN